MATSRLFGPLVKTQRCIVPVSGFYEWKGEKAPKQPYYIHAADGGTLHLAGLWEKWSPKGVASGKLQGAIEPGELPGSVITFTILTTTPNGVMAGIHNRMPVILDEAGVDAWLDASVTDAAAVTGLLKPCADEKLAVYPVSRRVNSPAFDGAECVERVEVVKEEKKGGEGMLF